MNKISAKNGQNDIFWKKKKKKKNQILNVYIYRT